MCEPREKRWTLFVISFIDDKTSLTITANIYLDTGLLFCYSFVFINIMGFSYVIIVVNTFFCCCWTLVSVVTSLQFIQYHVAGFYKPFLKVHPPISELQHMQQCQVRVFHNFCSKL